MNGELSKGEKTRSRILEEAISILAGEGFKALSVDHVVKKSNISKTMFYKYFNSKEKLLEAIREHRKNHSDVITQRDEILKKASQAFFRMGADEIDMDTIARASGLNRPSLYRYFSSKEELLEYAVQYEIKNRKKALDDIRNTGDSPMMQLAMVLEYTCNPPDRHFDTLMLATCRYKLYKNERIKESFNELIGDATDTVRSILEDGIRKGVFREDIDTQMASVMLMSLFDGMIFNHEFDLKNRMSVLEQHAYGMIMRFLKKPAAPEPAAE